MNEEVLVSIIIPTHNRAKTIERAIDSAFRQTYKKIEILVVDDFSNDNTFFILQEKYFRFDNFFYIKNEKSYGGGKARAIGVEKAHGELICFLDSDDEWKSDKLEKQINIWKNCGFQKDFFCFTNLQIMDATTGLPIESLDDKESQLGLDCSLGFRLFINNELIQTSSYMFTKELINKFNFREIPKHQDWDVLFRLYGSGVKMYKADDKLVRWYINSNQNTSSKNIPLFSMSWFNSIVKPVCKENEKRAIELAFIRKVIFPRHHLWPIDKFKAFNLSSLGVKIYYIYYVHLFSRCMELFFK